MSDIKQPTIKADGVQRNVTGMSAAVTKETEAATRKVAKKKAAAPVKKKVAGKKAAAAEKKPTAPQKRVTAATSAMPAPDPTPAKSAPAANPTATTTLSGEARQRMISEAAYLISLKRHAGAAGAEADWLYAETVIDMVFNSAD